MTHAEIMRLAAPYHELVVDTLLEGGGEDSGLCIRCGAERYGVEPDASEYPCDECGEDAVFGLEQLVFYLVP